MTPETLLQNLMQRYPVLKVCEDQILEAYKMLIRVYESGHILYVAGNGGSAADSDHIVGELMKSFMAKRTVDENLSTMLCTLYPEEGKGLCHMLEGGLPAISLPSLTALSTAISNDVAGNMIYAQMINSIGKAGDIFWGISTSGNSANIVNAAMVAKAKGLCSLGMTGSRACKLDEICDVIIHVPETDTYKVQELHLPIYHALCAMLESYFFRENDRSI